MDMRIVTLLALASAGALDAQQPTTPTTHLSGTVLGTWSGEPVGGVQIALASGGTQVTDSTGRFDFPAVRSGRTKLHLQYAGRISAERDIALPAGKSLKIEVLADSAATDFSPVIVSAEALERQLGLAGFYARRRLGFGRFFSKADLVSSKQRYVTQVLSQVGASYRCDGAGCVPVMFHGGRECRMTTLIDGFFSDQRDISTIELDDVLAIEVYRSGYEPGAGLTLENGYELAGLARPCGLVVIWTEAATPRSD